MSKHKKQQQKITIEAVEQQTVRSLKRQIKLLKRLPNDFRDISPGSSDWEAFAEATGRRKEMEKWAAGPVLCLKEPNAAEKMVLVNVNVIGDRFTNTSLAFSDWCVINIAVDNGYSWIYLPDEEPQVIAALNVILSRFEYNCRVRGQILSERTGKPIGLVH